jgi:hypothetical protein
MYDNNTSIKIFNTAIVTSKIDRNNKPTQSLGNLLKSDAFACILSSVRELSKLSNLSEDEAAEKIISTFREMDRVWDSYIFEEGLSQLKRQLTPTKNAAPDLNFSASN